MRRLLLPTLVVALIFQLALRPAIAHGGEVLFDRNVGVYGIAVLHTDNPENPLLISFIVYVTEPDTGPPVAGAVISLSGKSESTGATVQQASTADPQLEGYHNAEISFPNGGIWEIRLQVDSPRGKETGIFQLMVLDPASTGPTSSVWLFALPPIIIAAGVLLYFWIRTGREPFTEEGIQSEEAAV